MRDHLLRPTRRFPSILAENPIILNGSGVGVERNRRGLSRSDQIPHIWPMTRRRNKLPLIRQGLFFVGILLVIVSPLVGAIPGPGGIFVFAAGLALILQNSEWAKRQYVKFKRRHPNKGRWADWGMRRLSARRREARLKRAQAEEAEAGNAPVSD
jgi:hypothetical protein